MLFHEDYFAKVKQNMANDDFESAIACLRKGADAGDVKCKTCLYYMPKLEEVTWAEKCRYLEKYFYQFELGISFNQFVKDTGAFLHRDLFATCAKELRVDFEELRTYDYVNWVLVKKYNVPQAQVDAFWKRYEQNYEKNALKSILDGIDQLFNKK